MAAKPTSIPGQEPLDLSSLCLAITEHAPLPMATVEGASHIVRHVNPAFCRLMDKPKERIVGKPFCEMLPEKDECLMLLDRVYRTGKSESHTEQQASEPHPVFWSYAMWPVLADERPVGVVVQVTESAQFHEMTLAMNQALMLGSVRQHELTEASENLNAQLQTEISERKRAQEALRQSHAKLRSHAEELTRFNRAAVGRELRMIELKKELNELCQRQGEAARYPLAFEQEGKDTDGTPPAGGEVELKGYE